MARLPALLIAGRNLQASMHGVGGVLVRGFVVAVLLLCLVVSVQDRGLRSAPGLLLVQWFTSANLWLIWLCGCLLFPGILAQEREQGTWTLLRLAGLGPGSFLLGQSLAALAQVLLGILVQVPFLLLAVALGGTSTEVVATTTGMLLAHALAVYTLSLIASARARTVRGATLLALVLVPPFTFLPDVLASLLRSNALDVLLASVQVVLPSRLLADVRAGTVEPPEAFVAIGVQLAVAALAAAVAWVAFAAAESESEPRRVRGVASAPSGGAAPRVAAAAGFRFATGSAALRQLSRRFATGGPRLWLMLLFVYFAVVAALRRSTGPGPRMRMLNLLLLQGLVVVLLAAFLGAWSIRGHLAQRTAPLLALTQPTRAGWLHAIRTARWQTLVVAFATVVTTWLLTKSSQGVPRRETLAFLTMVGGATLLADAVGERCAFHSRTAPWAISVLVMVGVGTLMMAGGFVFQPRSVVGYFGTHGLLYLGVAVALLERTRQRAGEVR